MALQDRIGAIQRQAIELEDRSIRLREKSVMLRSQSNELTAHLAGILRNVRQLLSQHSPDQVISRK